MKKFSIDVRPKDCEPQRVALEAGHIYTHETPDEFTHFAPIALGNVYDKVLRSFGHVVVPYLLIDNYNPRLEGREEVLDVQGYLSAVAQRGFQPENVVMEADLVPAAEELLAKLRREGKVIEDEKRGGCLLGKGNVYLQDEGRYTCSLLDAAFTLEKLAHCDIAMNVLPEGFKSQQKRLVKILREVGVDTSRVIHRYVFSEPIARVNDLTTLLNAVDPFFNANHVIETGFSMGGDK